MGTGKPSRYATAKKKLTQRITLLNKAIPELKKNHDKEKKAFEKELEHLRKIAQVISPADGYGNPAEYDVEEQYNRIGERLDDSRVDYEEDLKKLETKLAQAQEQLQKVQYALETDTEVQDAEKLELTLVEEDFDFRKKKAIPTTTNDQESFVKVFRHHGGTRRTAQLFTKEKTLPQSIDISEINLDDVGQEALAEALKKNQTIVELILKPREISREGTKAIAKALKLNKTLTRLKVNGDRIHDEGRSALAELLKVTKAITKFTLEYCKSQGKGIEALIEAFKFNKTVTNLCLKENLFSSKETSGLAEVLKTNQTIANFTISGGKAPGITNIIESLEVNQSVRKLRIRYTEMACEGAKTLARALRVNQTITTVDLTGNEIGDEGIEELSEALKVNRSVTSLVLTYNQIDCSIEALAAVFTVNQTLADLEIRENKAQSFNVEPLAEALKTNRTIKRLVLAGNRQIGKEGVKSLLEMLKVNKTITHFDFSQSLLGDEGAQTLAEAISVNQTVTNLNVERTEIGTEGAKLLAEAFKINRTIIELSLASNFFDEEGANVLTEAIKANQTITTPLEEILSY